MGRGRVAKPLKGGMMAGEGFGVILRQRGSGGSMAEGFEA
jgi:hypothetical protein